ncbi:MAG TPA: terminase [Steroidobacteraceae bacterium]|nr:terminase [Steroidobacteraceae bacterium]
MATNTHRAGGIRGLLAWQWEGYARYHQSRVNLLLHVLLVPLFLAGNIAVVTGLVRLDWIEAVFGMGCMAVSMVLQGRGHRGEPVPPVPFGGTGNALGRIFLEQWITFPRFVLSGGWWGALRGISA